MNTQANEPSTAGSGGPVPAAGDGPAGEPPASAPGPAPSGEPGGPTAPGQPGGPAAPGQPGEPGGPTASGDPAQRGPHHPGHEFFDRIRGLGVVRPDQGRWGAGVCAGIAQRLGLDPLLVRGIFVALTVVGGFGLMVYGLAWLFLPEPDGRIHAEGVLRGVVTAGFVGALIATLFGLGWTNTWPHEVWLPWSPPVGLVLTALLALGVWWLLIRDRPAHAGSPATGLGAPGGPAGGSPGGPAGSPGGSGGAAVVPPTPTYRATGSTAQFGAPPEYGPPTWSSSAFAGGGAAPAGYQTATAGPAGPTGAGYPPATATVAPRRRFDLHAPSHALTRATLGVALLAAAICALWYRLDGSLRGHGFVVATLVALGVVALGVVLAGLLGRRAGGLAPVAIVLALVAVNGTILDNTSITLGQRTWRPAAAAAGEHGYQLGIGDATVDLTDPGLTAGRSAADPVNIPVHLGIGRLRLILPAAGTVEVHASVGAGNVNDHVDQSDSPNSADASGTGLSRVLQSGGGQPVIVVDAQVGVGELQVDNQFGRTS